MTKKEDRRDAVELAGQRLAWSMAIPRSNNNAMNGHYWLKLSFVLLLLGFSLQWMNAQENPSPREIYQNSEVAPRQFDTKKWSQTIEGIDYSQSLRKDDDYDQDFFNTEERDKQKQIDEAAQAENSAFWNKFVKILFVSIGLGILIFVIYGLVRGNLFRPRSQSFDTKNKFDIETIEDHLHESDLDQLIQQNINDSNFALAIRLYYLAIIKELSIRRIIKWKKDKTNRDYQRELQGYSLFREFREATQIFERVWYGNRELLVHDFQQLQPRFQQWINQAQQLKKK